MEWQASKKERRAKSMLETVHEADTVESKVLAHVWILDAEFWSLGMRGKSLLGALHQAWCVMLEGADVLSGSVVEASSVDQYMLYDFRYCIMWVRPEAPTNRIQRAHDSKFQQCLKRVHCRM